MTDEYHPSKNIHLYLPSFIKDNNLRAMNSYILLLFSKKLSFQNFLSQKIINDISLIIKITNQMNFKARLIRFNRNIIIHIISSSKMK